MSLQDGNITTEELIAFFGETGTKKDVARNARYWLKEIDGYGKTDGYITLVGSHMPLGQGRCCFWTLNSVFAYANRSVKC